MKRNTAMLSYGKISLQLAKQLPSETAPVAIQTARKEIFDKIYQAAINQDEELITKINRSYFGFGNELNYLSVSLDGYTPLIKLAAEGKVEAIKFLIEHGGNLQEAKLGLVYCDNVPVELKDICNDVVYRHGHDIFWIADMFAHHEPPEEMRKIINDWIPELKIKNIMHSLRGKPEETKDSYVENCTYPYLIAYGLAKGGWHEKLQPYLEKNEINIRTYALMGYLAGGYLNAIENIFAISMWQPKATLASLKYVMKDLPGEMYHFPILYTFLNYFNNDFVRKEHVQILKAHLNNISVDDINDKKKFVDAGIKLFDSVEKLTSKLNLRMRKYSINQAQAEILNAIENIIWLQQGLQLVESNVLPLELLIKIQSYLTPQLTLREIIDLSEKLSFLLPGYALINALEKYEAPYYDSKRYHAERCASFRKACENAISLPELKEKVAYQHAFFFQPSDAPIINKKNVQKHERKPHSTTKDRFTDILETYQRRFKSR